MSDVTVRITDKTFREVEEIVYGSGKYDLLVHGTRDETIVCVTGDGDVMAAVTALGMTGEIRAYG